MTNNERIRSPHLRESLNDVRLRQILWPVQIVHLMAERDENDSELGPFELLVLSFLQADSSLTMQSLASQICVPEDFISCIIRRLQDRKLVDNDLKVGNVESKKKLRPVNMLAFRELVSGEVLPFVVISSKTIFSFDQVKADENSFLLPVKHSPSPITISDISWAFKMMKQRAQHRLDLPKLKTIRFVTSDETGVLRCYLTLDKTDGGVRIVNPFTDKANPFENTLEVIFDKEESENSALSQWMLNWRRSVRVQNIDAQNSIKYPFDTSANRKYFPQLVAALKRLSDFSYESVYAVIEWALFYSEQISSGINTASLHASYGPELTIGNLQLLGTKIGLPETVLETVDEVALKRYSQGQPEMITALVVSAEKSNLNPNMPFARLLAEDLEFIPNILKLKQLRDRSVHGNDANNEADESIIQWMRSVVRVLIPSFEFSVSDLNKLGGDSMVVARSEMIEKIGQDTFNSLSWEAKNHLQRAQLNLLSNRVTEDATQLIGHICAALEAEFRRCIRSIDFQGLTDGELMGKIAERFSILGISPPEVLMQTKEIRFRRALQQSNKTTLGACVLAWMLTIDMNLLQAHVSGCPTLFNDVSRMIELREHLNKQTPMSRKEIQGLFDKGCRIVKIINTK